MRRLGISLISGIIFIALTISATVIVYEAGMPVIRKVQDSALIENMKGAFSELDQIARQVASEGQGSKRTAHLELESGTLVVNGSQDVIYWSYETDAFVMSPRTSQQFGNMVIGNNLETSAKAGNYTMVSPAVPAYILENDHLRVYIKQIGSPGSPASYDTKDIVLAIYQKDLDRWLNNTGFLEFMVDSNPTSATGTGYTVLEKAGEHLPYATVSAYMQSSYSNYWINLTLESGTDFLEIGANI
jgi:hypothetical protein